MASAGWNTPAVWPHPDLPHLRKYRIPAIAYGR